MHTEAPKPASKRVQSAYGCVTATLLIGVFLAAGVVSMLLPLPRTLEDLREPIAIGLGIGGVVVVALMSMAPLLLFRSGERARMDRLFGTLHMTGRSDPGHGAEYRGRWGTRACTASVSLDGASPVTRHTRASFGLDAHAQTRMVWCRRGSPYLQVWSPPDAKHVLLSHHPEVDVRATDPARARTLSDQPEFWAEVEALLGWSAEAESVLTVAPDHVMLRVDGDNATLFEAEQVHRVFTGLERIAIAIEAATPTEAAHPSSDAWIDLAHNARRSMRWRQWGISFGCVGLLLLGWVAWVGAIVWKAGFIH